MSAHAELSKALAAALRTLLLSPSGAPFAHIDDARHALAQYDNTSQPARRNRREAQRARLCVAALEGMSDDSVSRLKAALEYVKTRPHPQHATFSPSSLKHWPCPNTGD